MLGRLYRTYILYLLKHATADMEHAEAQLNLYRKEVERLRVAAAMTGGLPVGH